MLHRGPPEGRAVPFPLPVPGNSPESEQNMIQVLVNGARGKMGSEAVRAVQAESDLELVAATDVEDSLVESIRQSGAQVVVDFTHPDSALANAEAILDAGARPVIGTTGFTPEQIESLVERSRKAGLGGVIAPNFAIGAILMMKFAADAARFLPDVEIIELHHNQKADAPSGTAVKTAEWILESRGQAQGVLVDETETISGARGAEMEGLRIHSVRLPGLVAHQEVLLGGKGQLLSLRHDALNRESFMPGVVMAIREVMERRELVYGLEHLMDL